MQYWSFNHNKHRIKSLTGMSQVDFESLARVFGREWENYIGHYTLEGRPRQRQSKPRKNSVLSTTEDKLFFLLYYLKLNPLQETLAATFGLSQPQANDWLELLRGLLLAALKQEAVLPERKAARLYRLVEGEEKVIIDVTERSVGRSIDNETQKEYYSGKKSPYN